MEIIVKCPFCKANIPANALKCSHCTADLTNQEIQEKIQREVKKKKKDIIAILLVFISFISIGVVASLSTSSTPTPEPYSQQRIIDKSVVSSQKITPEKLQEAVKSMAEFMVKDDNKIGLKMWVKHLGQSAHDFESAESLYEKIRQASNDFAVYRNSKEVLNLLEVLGNTDIIFDEVLLESLKEKTK